MGRVLINVEKDEHIKTSKIGSSTCVCVCVNECDAFQFLQCLYLITNVYMSVRGEGKIISRFFCTRLSCICAALLPL